MIILHLRDLPPGVTPRMAAALVYGRARAERDTLVIIETVDRLDDDPAVSQQPAASFAAPADVQSAATQSVDHRGITFVTLQAQAQERGLSLTMLSDGTYRLDTEYGAVTRQHVTDLIEFIKSPRQVIFE